MGKAKNLIIDGNTPFEIIQLEYGLNVKNRIVYLEQPFDVITPAIINGRIHAITSISGDSKSPITLYIPNYGGSVYGMFGVYDLIQSVPMKINTKGTAAVMSAATIILAGGTGKRTITPNTTVMIHQASGMLQGTTSDINNEASQISAIQNNMVSILEKHTKKDAKFWKTKIRAGNIYLPPDKCLEYGIIDEVE